MTEVDMDTASGIQENLRSHANHLHGHVAGASLVRLGAVEIADSGRQHDTFNVMCMAAADLPILAEDAELCAEYARSAGRPFSFWALGETQVLAARRLLPHAGFGEGESERVMIANLDPSHTDDVASPLSVSVATSSDDIREYAQLLAANWDPPAVDVAEFLVAADDYLRSEDALSRLLIGRVDGRVVSGAEVHFAGGMAGIYGVATLESFRGRGFGGKIMSSALELAVRHGYLRSCLQATEDGAGIYRRHGYQQIDDCQEFAIG